MPPTEQADKSNAQKSAGSKPKIVEHTDTTEGFISDGSNLPENETAGQVTSSDECIALDSSMPHQITDLLELTYAAEVQFEEALNPDACVGNMQNLVTSVANLSTDESSHKHLENSEAPITIPAVSDQKDADSFTSIFSMTPATNVKSLKPGATVTKCTLFDSKSGEVQVTHLNDIVLPNTKSKGRPRGRALMAIGLPIKKEPVSFVRQRPVVQARMILRWLISDEHIIQNALTGEYLIGKGDLPSNHEELPDSIVADEVHLSILTQYLDEVAFQTLTKIVQKKKDSGIWNCKACNGVLSEFCILCDSCLYWYDYPCVNLKRDPKTERWFCPRCKQ